MLSDVTNSVTRQFEARFGQTPLTFDSHLASSINPAEFDALVSTEKSDCIRKFELAKCRRPGTSHFPSMAEQFGVSNTAMAYRLKELGL